MACCQARVQAVGRVGDVLAQRSAYGGTPPGSVVRTGHHEVWVAGIGEERRIELQERWIGSACAGAPLKAIGEVDITPAHPGTLTHAFYAVPIRRFSAFVADAAFRVRAPLEARVTIRHFLSGVAYKEGFFILCEDGTALFFLRTRVRALPHLICGACIRSISQCMA